MVVKEDKPINCTIVGDAMIGKSTLVKAFMNDNKPDTAYVATILETFEGSLDINGQKHKLNIFDNAGQHDYDNMRTTSYKENECLVLCYSVADRDSMESVKEFWVPELRNCAGRRKPVILVATQTDLRTDNGNFISTAEGEILAKDIGAESFLECSAFVKDSVTKVFRQMTTAGLRYRKKRVGLVNRIFGK